MQNLIVSMMRFSAAATLFGIEQIENTMSILDGSESISGMTRMLTKTLDSMTDAMVTRIDTRKKDALKSITRLSEEVVERSMDGLELVDPRAMVRAGNNLAQSTTETTASLIQRAVSATEKVVKEGASTESVNVDDMTVEEVLDAVEKGKMTAEQAIQAEKKGKNRSTLISALENKVVNVNQMTVDEVLAAVDSGRITAEEAVQAEKKGKNRASLITALEIENMTVEEVLAAVDNGKVSGEEAIRAEKKGKNRATLITSLESKVGT